MVECEYKIIVSIVVTILVLIDTWWNVNQCRVLLTNSSMVVLIDTWWNVNDVINSLLKSGGVGFNRYMVECE